MIGIIVASHGGFAKELIKSAEMIVGEQEGIEGLSLEMDEEPHELRIKIGEALRRVDGGDGAIILVDLLGGSPGNAAGYFAMEGIPVITGVNLPMLLELIIMREAEVSDAVNHVIEMGKEGIQDLRIYLRG